MEITSTTTALVTGANGGLGTAIARALKKAGAQVILSGRKPEALEALAKELGARVVLADLQDNAQVERMLAEVGPVDILVANAALPCSGELKEFTVEQIDRALDVNLRVPILMARALAPKMVENKRGQLIFINSISGKLATSATSLYNATKYGLRGFALAMRAELAPHNVGVSTIFPGFIREAGMFAQTGIELPAGVGTRSPEDVANGVLYAVRSNPAEVSVAALSQRFGAFVGVFSFDFITWIQRAAGGDKVASQLVEKQKHKR